MSGQAGAPWLPQQQQILAGAALGAVTNLPVGPVVVFHAAVGDPASVGSFLQVARGEGSLLATPRRRA
eukprot:8916817-Prorocentrum_lima.AAC.1